MQDTKTRRRKATRGVRLASLLACSASITLCGSAPARQPAIGRSADEPAWPDLLKQQWGLHVHRDLRNPAIDGVAPAGLFRRADSGKPVTATPIIALGMEAPTHGGWYAAGPLAGDLPDDAAGSRRELWSYAFKQPDAERASGRFTPPPCRTGSKEFDPGDRVFGLWVRNETWDDGGVYTQPAMVAKVNARLAEQPYKAMIYPNRDVGTGRLVANSYIIGFEYSTNDDFQDVVVRLDNVRLLPANPPLKGILAREAKVRKLAGGFAFTEGPAWDFRDNALLFSDIPRNQILRYADGRATVASATSGRSNGLMFDKQGSLIACEGAEQPGGGRRVSRRKTAGQPGESIAAQYDGKRLNSPNDLWIDAAGGIYFTDPRYGRRESMEMTREAVYYLAPGGKLVQVVHDLVRPNGIALSPDGKWLYVVDNGAETLWRYKVLDPGRLSEGERIADVTAPDGMTVDRQGRLYVTGAGGIWVLDADGAWIGCIETPEHPANCTFGGAGYRTLFITARTSLYAVETDTRGWHVHLDGLPGGR